MRVIGCDRIQWAGNCGRRRLDVKCKPGAKNHYRLDKRSQKRSFAPTLPPHWVNSRHLQLSGKKPIVFNRKRAKIQLKKGTIF
jgi:hypothetical protein